MRLAELSSPAVAKLAQLLLHAGSEAVQLRAAEAILDRAGYGRATKVEAVATEEAKALLFERLSQLQEAAGVDDEEETDEGNPE